MTNRPVVKLTRKQIYDEVWSVAVSGMASKYSIPYSSLLKQLKDANIPIPPSGYWTKKEFDKELTETPLDGDPDEIVALYRSSAAASKARKTGEQIGQEEKRKVVSPQLEAVPEEKSILQKEKVNIEPLAALGEPEVLESWGGKTRNVYHREVLYQEVWQFPVTEVAKKYSVSDVAIHKICKSLDIPTPPPGYWAKRRAGKEVAIPPLPKSDKGESTTGKRTQKLFAQSTEEQLAHLSEEEQAIVLAVASEIVLVGDYEKMNAKVAAFNRKANGDNPPEIVNAIAKESLPRAIKILDTLVKAVEPLGVEVNDRLSFSIGKDAIQLHFSEATKEIPHQLTRDEKKALLEYEDAVKCKRWARRPNIRKYDHPYNGTLNLSISDKRKFRDSKAGLLEDRLGEILIAIFYCINEAKLAREAREEAERKREEQKRREEEARQRYNEEIAKTKELVNMAEDYEVACKIRTMVAAAEAQGTVDAQWIAWAKAKADWYDPVIAATDEFFGKRKHEKEAEQKALREQRSGYWW